MNSIQQDIIKLIESLKQSGVQEISFSIKFNGSSESDTSKIQTLNETVSSLRPEIEIPTEMTLGDL